MRCCPHLPVKLILDCNFYNSICWISTSRRAEIGSLSFIFEYGSFPRKYPIHRWQSRQGTTYIPLYEIVNFQDLSYLNRDLEKVILVDTNPDSVRLQPDNAILMEKWKGDPRDKELVALIPFLECTPFPLEFFNE